MGSKFKRCTGHRKLEASDHECAVVTVSWKLMSRSGQLFSQSDRPLVAGHSERNMVAIVDYSANQQHLRRNRQHGRLSLSYGYGGQLAGGDVSAVCGGIAGDVVRSTHILSSRGNRAPHACPQTGSGLPNTETASASKTTGSAQLW